MADRKRNPNSNRHVNPTPEERALGRTQDVRFDLEDFTPTLREGVVAGERLNVAPSDNLVANGIFEAEDVSKWDTAGGTVEYVDLGVIAQDPLQPFGMKFTSDGSPLCALYYGYDGTDPTGALLVDEGLSYSVSVDIYGNANRRSIAVSLVFCDELGNEINTEIPVDLAAAESATWRTYSAAGVAPVGAVQAYVQVQFISVAAAEVWYLDNAFVTFAGGFQGPYRTKDSGRRVSIAGDRINLLTEHPQEWAAGTVRAFVVRKSTNIDDDQFGAQIAAPRTQAKASPRFNMYADSPSGVNEGYFLAENAVMQVPRGFIGLHIAALSIPDDVVAALSTWEHYGGVSVTLDKPYAWAQDVSVYAWVSCDARATAAALHTAWARVEISMDAGATWSIGQQRRTTCGVLAGAARENYLTAEHMVRGVPTGQIRARCYINQQGGAAGAVTWENGRLYILSIPAEMT